ncbi:toll/interleukin-1 receptor domain-containing protein [Anaeromicrobium sediminis]|nr:toll/interleukin-1 receptor domain-containing protein [Anaeromicrobium sediminis]
MERFEEWTIRKRKLDDLNPYKFAREINIDENEAIYFFKELETEGYLIGYIICDCPACGNECYVEHYNIDNLYECEECEELINIRNLRKKDVSYSINKEMLVNGIKKCVNPIELMLEEHNEKVIRIDRNKGVDSIKGKIKTKDEGVIKMERKSTRIFISHSEKDKVIVRKLIRLLHDIGIPKQKEFIFCSSYEGYNVPPGEDISEYIRKEFDENILVIFMLSENFYNSPACLCEMGAVWVKTKKHIPLLIPPFQFKEIKGFLNSNTRGIHINKSEGLDSFSKKITEEFNLPNIDITIWGNDKRDFLEDIKNLLEG